MIKWLSDFVFREQVCLKNLGIAFPEKSEIELRLIYKESVAFFLNCIKEILSGAVYRREWLEKNVEVENFSDLKHHLSEGCVLFSAHFSNFEILPQLSYVSPKKVYFLAKTLRPKFFNSIVIKLRQKNNAVFTPNLKVVLNYLKQNGVAGFLFDQHSSNKRAKLYDFFSKPATLNPLVYLLARHSKPVFIYLVKKSKYNLRWKVISGADLSEELLANLLNKELERIIIQNPEQYFWFHRRWKISVNYEE